MLMLGRFRSFLPGSLSVQLRDFKEDAKKPKINYIPLFTNPSFSNLYTGNKMS